MLSNWRYTSKAEYTGESPKKIMVETNQAKVKDFPEEIVTKEDVLDDKLMKLDDRTSVKNSGNKVSKKTDKKDSTVSVNKTQKDVRKTVTSHQEKKTPSHVHDWEPIYSYETIEDICHELREICKGCGADITTWSTSKWNEHSDAHLLAGEPAGFYEKEFKVVTGTHEIRKLVGYKCSCGATK